MRAASSRPDDDVTRFVDALAFDWLIGGTDAHAKNYALLIGAGGRAFTLDHPEAHAISALLGDLGIDRPLLVRPGGTLRYRAQIDTPAGLRELS